MVPITGTLPSKDLRAAEAQTTAMHTVATLKKMGRTNIVFILGRCEIESNKG